MSHAQLQLRLFGVPTLTRDGREIVLAAQRPTQLLALLASRRNWVQRDELAEWLWPERGGAQSRSNLRTALARAQALVHDEPIEQQADRLRWLPDSDVQQFEHAVEAGHHDAAVALYRGRLLQGLDAESSSALAEWLTFERERLAGRWRDAASHCILEHQGDPRAVLALAEKVLAQEPMDETALAALAQARAALGERDEGLRRLVHHAQELQRRYALEPSARLQALALALRQDHAVPLTPQAARADSAGVLAPAGFVGRRMESTQLVSLLAQPACRVLTLVGPGGVGKSTLARHALALPDAPWHGRACWVALEGLGDVDAVPGQVASALAAQSGASQLDSALPANADAWRALALRLGGAAWLVGLDGAEHLPALGPRLAVLLAACPQLKLLVTSRQRLAVAGEQLLPLDGLPLPDIDETDADVLRHCDAVQLFDVCARAVQPGFDLATQAADVVQLVHVVEGLPLAIALGAAGVRLMPVHALLAELRRSIDVLDAAAALSGTDGRPPRERSVRASFDHSWQALSDGERAALAALAALPAPLGREMARQVARVELPTLAVLVDKSLLRADGAGRFEMHALLRQFVMEQARLSDGSRQALSRRHAAHVGRLLQLHEDFNLADPRAAVREIGAELAHVRSAWQWALLQRDAAFCARHAQTLAHFFAYQGLIGEGLAALQRAFDVFDAADGASQSARANAGLGLTQLQVRVSRLDDAEATARTTLKIARALRDTRLVVRCLNWLALAIGGRGGSDTPRPLLLQALRLARQHGHRAEAGLVLANLARLEKVEGHFDAAQALFREALDIARSGARPNREALVLQTSNLANLLAAQGRWHEALPLFEQAWAESQAAAILVHQPLLQLNQARAHLALGRPAQAEAWAARAVRRAHELGRPLIACHATLVRVRAAVAAGQAEAARQHLRQALDDAQTLNLPAERARCVVAFAELRAAEGDMPAAHALWHWAAAQAALPQDDVDEIQARLRGRSEVPQAAAAPQPVGDEALAQRIATIVGQG